MSYEIILKHLYELGKGTVRTIYENALQTKIDIKKRLHEFFL